MNLMLRRDPFNEIKALQEDFSRIFGSTFPNLAGSFREEGLLRGNWMPNVDIAESENEIVLEADLPGLKPGEFDISVENRILTLKGERKFEKKNDSDQYHRVERSYGNFTRTFTLPASVNVDEVSAEYKDGILRVTLPKKAEVRARQIQVKVNSEEGAINTEAATK